jgi:hypothetical protein
MASIKTTSATSALNEDKYINKLYDTMVEKQKSQLTENQNAATGDLDALNQSVQQQVDTINDRTNVEAQKVQQNYNPPKVSPSAQQQISLAMDNQKKKNLTSTQTVQNEADAEIERQRKLIGQQYAAAIQKAQAENDMIRAQQLYEAAKKEEEQLNALKLEAGKSLSAVGDNSITNAMLAGETATRDTTSETWDDVLKNEESLNKIYDSAMESARLDAQMAKNEALSEIEAAQAADMSATDKNLTQAYVNALKSNKNYNEVQNAYGLGSGNMAQQQLARALGMTEDLTNLRNVYAANTANRGQKQFAVGENYRDAIAGAMADTEKNRAAALLDAAEAEEQNLIAMQKSLGSTLAAQKDYSVLGKLYGLTQDQIDRLQGTGAYAPKPVTSSKKSSGGSGGSGATTLAKALSNYYGTPSSIGTNVTMTSDQVSTLYKNLDNAKKLDAQKKEQDAEKQAIVAGNKAAARNNKKKK